MLGLAILVIRRALDDKFRDLSAAKVDLAGSLYAAAVAPDDSIAGLDVAMPEARRVDRLLSSSGMRIVLSRDIGRWSASR